MTNNRPFLIFITIIVVLGAAFWGVLKFASGYNERRTRPQPVHVATENHPQPSPQQKAPSSVQPTSPPATKAPSQTTPPSAAPKSQAPTPVPAPEKPKQAPPASQPSSASAPHPVAVPATGASASIALTGIFIGAATFLAITVRRQIGQLRPNR